ncbi:MAG: hypothetical protein IJV35_09885 [Neisseriaceae bacterium]|nr:hypothetical protein [Neisseriaceae bacterium]
MPSFFVSGSLKDKEQRLSALSVGWEAHPTAIFGVLNFHRQCFLSD